LPLQQAIPKCRLLLIICGCLALVGILLSTGSAQPIPPATAPSLSTRGGPAARRRKTLCTPDVSRIAASYARYSSDLQDVSSIDQQRRRCHDRAQQDGNAIPPEFEFANEAVSGTRRDREGLNAMLAAARQRRFGILSFDSLSRLAREFVITVPMLKELVYVCKVRVASVSEGVDSANGNWELNAIFRSWMHQEYIKVLRDAVLRGQEEAVLRDWSVGDLCFGYGSEPIPGSESGRGGRHPRPRKRVVIDEDHARWVRRIFDWFVEERRPLA
jgi:DNA invertase Pin-like site-specific DNA recombinase